MQAWMDLQSYDDTVRLHRRRGRQLCTQTSVISTAAKKNYSVYFPSSTLREKMVDSAKIIVTFGPNFIF